MRYRHTGMYDDLSYDTDFMSDWLVRDVGRVGLYKTVSLLGIAAPVQNS